MPIPTEAIELENQSLDDNGGNNLFGAYRVLKQLWLDGDRDRELGLHLMFLAWYGIIEPEHITAFPESDEMRQELMQTLTEVHAYFEPQIHQDAEMLYVVGVAAQMFWFMFDDAELWEKRSAEYHQHYRALLPNGIDPTIFHNRGYYGEYYSGQAAVEGGY